MRRLRELDSEHEAMINMIRWLSAPIRKLLRFPLVQLAIVLFLVLVMQAADDGTPLGEAFNALDKLVDLSVGAVAANFPIKSLTKSFLSVGVTIAYVYLALWVILSLARIAARLIADFIGRQNIFWLRSAIARERGIGAYRAWLPLEKIRPTDTPQHVWEERYAWPRNNLPPYPPLLQRTVRGALVYLGLLLFVATMLQAFTRWAVLDWLVEIAKRAIGI
jgi:hypothetical protein